MARQRCFVYRVEDAAMGIEGQAGALLNHCSPRRKNSIENLIHTRSQWRVPKPGHAELLVIIIERRGFKMNPPAPLGIPGPPHQGLQIYV